MTTGQGLTIAPNRDVLLMSRELMGKIEDAEEDAASERYDDPSPTVVIKRTTPTRDEDPVVGQLCRLQRHRRGTTAALRTTCDQALEVFADLADTTRRTYGTTSACVPGGHELTIAQGLPDSVEVCSVTRAGVCTLVLFFAAARGKAPYIRA